MTNRLAYLLITPELIKEFLFMPADLEITGAGWDFDNRCLKLLISHPDLKELEPHRAVPTTGAVITKEPFSDYKYTWKFNQEPK